MKHDLVLILFCLGIFTAIGAAHEHILLLELAGWAAVGIAILLCEIKSSSPTLRGRK